MGAGAARTAVLRVAPADAVIALGEDFVAVRFPAMVAGQGFTHRCQLAVEDGGEAVDGGLGDGVIHFDQHHEAGRAFDQRARRRLTD